MAEPAVTPARSELAPRARSFARLAAMVLACLLVSLLVFRSSRGAFATTTANSGNSIAAGTVDLVDDDSGSALITVSAMKPADSVVRCITVTYQGSLAAATIRLYGTSGGTGLGTYLDTTIEEGTGGAFGDCTGFSAASTVFSGTLAGFAAAHTGFSNGAAAFTTSSTPTARTFRFTLTLEDNNAAQGLTALPTFTWEAQST